MVSIYFADVSTAARNGLNEELRNGCMAPFVVLISHSDSHQQAAISAGADGFISSGEMIERVVDRFRGVAQGFNL
jgi:DNA-binding NarL/FixJ family response regulator